MYKAINWNNLEEKNLIVFWNQNIRQFWVDEEISISEDINTWNNVLNEEQRRVYKKICAMLTLLDTVQGGNGMLNIGNYEKNLHNKALLSYIGFMEQMHAKSYSTIFSTFCSTEEIDELFNWVENDILIQRKIDKIATIYNLLLVNQNEEWYIKSLCASVILETFLFYSGFFFPLYLAGQGILVNSAEIFNLIIRDESIHGVYIGWLFKKNIENKTDSEIKKIHNFITSLIDELLDIEVEIANELYEGVGLSNEVINFMKYNANKALNNLGFDNYFDICDDDVNIIVFNGLKTDTKNHDFFSVKGNGYIKNVNKVEFEDNDFNW